MTKQAQMKLLLEHSQSAVDAAAKRLAVLKQQCRAAEEKLQTLKSYRADYQQRLQSAARNGIGIQAMREYYSFLGNLELAIHAQQDAALRYQGQWEAMKQEWLSLRRDAKAYEVLAQRQLDREKIVIARREQRTQDEYAALLKRRVATRE